MLGAQRRHELRPARARGAAESLGQIVLGFEAVIVFLAGLVAFGLKALPKGVPDSWAVVGGIVLAVLMLLACTVLRHRWGIIAGWLLQVVVALTAFLMPATLIIVVLFGGTWAFAVIKGGSLDRRNAKLAREAGGDTPDSSTNGD